METISCFLSVKGVFDDRMGDDMAGGVLGMNEREGELGELVKFMEHHLDGRG